MGGGGIGENGERREADSEEVGQKGRYLVGEYAWRVLGILGRRKERKVKRKDKRLDMM